MIQFGRVDKSTEIKIPVYRKSNTGNLPPEESFAVGDQIIFLKNDKRKFLKDVNSFLSREASFETPASEAMIEWQENENSRIVRFFSIL